MREFELKQGRGTVKFSINEKDIIVFGGIINFPHKNEELMQQ